ncbi:uncharacterized protein K02A2.6-like [Cydia pomonella]|uniref:uncharacterized protein K02A2.6-like n=1 Tax=Cydia pomonella TaxID=82600 RepID=UPI002ADD6DB8|nr:uncharacterized protein K02A2.6-like [Cydia pomonella]
MSGATFGLLSSFDHTTQSWETYKGRIAQWFIANDIDDTKDAGGQKRRAILLSALSDGTYKLAADLALPKELQSVPYEDIVKLLDDHFTPKRCGFGERYKFYAATQQSGETFPQWAARLRGLSAYCGFSNVEEALRDKFVMGMSSGPEKEKLFARDLTVLTLAKAVELAESVHCARAGAAASQPVQISQDQLFKVEKTLQRDSTSANTGGADGKKEQCQVCGYYNHKTLQCRFAKSRCKKCKATGHLKRMCKSVNFMAVNAVDEGDDDDGECYKIFNIRSNKGEPMIETVLMFHRPINLEIDTGAAVTALHVNTYKKHFSDVPLSATKNRLITFTGDNIPCLGAVRLPVTYANQTHTLKVYVVRKAGADVLGRDFISRFNLELAIISPVRYCGQNQETSNTIRELEKRYTSVFSDKLGQFNKYKVSLHLQLKENAKPVFIRARPIAFALRDKVDKEIDRLLSLGVLKPVDHSQYASPIVPVLKRNGAIRICADYSTGVNKQLVVDQYPLPTVTELFAKLYGGKQFTKLDLSNAYNQFELDEKSQELTCVNTHRGLFTYTRMVFGLSSAPAVFQRAMEGVLAGVPGTLCLLDDVLVTGENTEQHLTRLNEVLRRLQEAGLTLQKEKCEFFKDEVNYLGYVIDKHGLHKSPLKVKAMLDAPIPQNEKQLQSFLGLVNYYRSFVPNASAILSPLYDLLKKGVKWCWTEEHDRAFAAIKQCLASEQVLAHFNPAADIVLTVDAGPHGLGAILSQIEADGTERPISFASRTLNAAEKRYSQLQKEATSIIFGIRRYHQYLYGRAVPFTLRTDHKPLLSIFGPYRGIPEVSANRLQRYAMFLSGYNYKIEYVRSADNNADFLSRACLPGPAGARGEAARCATATTDIPDRASYINFVVDGNLPVTLTELRQHTERDTILQKVIHFILNGWPKKVSEEALKPYYLCRLQLSYENGCVMRGHKVVIPAKLQSVILAEVHQSHLGIVKTKAEVRSRFWFPGVDAALERLISACTICIQQRPSPARAPLAQWEYPPCAFHRIHCDFLGPINGSSYLVIVDAYTKWVEVYNMKTTMTSLATIEKICEFMSRFGIPHTLVTDNGTSFTSREFEAFCMLNGISHVTSPAYNAASNGQAESYVKIIKKGIKTSILSGNGVQNSWKRLLKYLFDYRNSVHTTTGVSPAQLVYGRKLKTRLDLINPKISSPSSPALVNTVRKNQCLQNKSSMCRKAQCFSRGELVLFKAFEANGKFKWCRGTIVKKVGKVVYIVKDNITFKTFKKHKNQIVLDKGHGCAYSSYSDEDIEIQDDDTSSAHPLSPAPSEERQPNSTGEEREWKLVPDPQPTSSAEPIATPPRSIPGGQSEEDDEFLEALPGPVTEPETRDSEVPADNNPVPTTSRSKRNRPKINYKPFF